MDPLIILPLAKGAILAAAVALVYCVPMLLAALYRHPRRRRITTLNGVLGWTVLGWVVALVWALQGRRYYLHYG